MRSLVPTSQTSISRSLTREELSHGPSVIIDSSFQTTVSDQASTTQRRYFSDSNKQRAVRIFIQRYPRHPCQPGYGSSFALAILMNTCSIHTRCQSVKERNIPRTKNIVVGQRKQKRASASGEFRTFEETSDETEPPRKRRASPRRWKKRDNFHSSVF